MNEEDYLKERVQSQIDWYDRKSVRNQTWFRFLRVVAILASATIPFLTGYITETTILLKLIVGILGLSAAVIMAILGIYRFQENWLEYRTTCESLKHEKYLFLTKATPYDIEEPFGRFVERVESLISKENSAWYRFMRKDKKQE